MKTINFFNKDIKVLNSADVVVIGGGTAGSVAAISVLLDVKMYGEEYTLVTVGDYVLKHTPGNTVSNLSSTRALRDVTRAYGCEYNAAAV